MAFSEAAANGEAVEAQSEDDETSKPATSPKSTSKPKLQYNNDTSYEENETHKLLMGIYNEKNGIDGIEVRVT